MSLPKGYNSDSYIANWVCEFAAFCGLPRTDMARDGIVYGVGTWGSGRFFLKPRCALYSCYRIEKF